MSARRRRCVIRAFPPADVSAACRTHSVSVTSFLYGLRSDKLYRTLPDDEHRAAFFAANTVLVTVRIDHEGARAVRAALVALRSRDHENELEPRVPMFRPLRSRDVTEQRGARPSPGIAPEATDLDTVAKRFPAGGRKSKLREFSDEPRFQGS